MNAGKSKVMVFERREVEDTPYSVNMPAVGRCKIVLGEKMEAMKELKYLRTVLCMERWKEK